MLIPLFFLPCSAASQGRVPGTGPSRAVLRARAAAEKSPDDPKARYNLGNALYRDGDHAAALEAYDQAEASFRPPDLRARASYNAGNALFRQGKLSEAVEKYKQALRSNPGDVDAKHNLELAQKILKSKPAAPKGGEDEKKQDGGGEDSPPKPPSSAPKPGEMTKEDAERLLQAVAQQEKEAREKMKSDRPTSVPAGEDW